MTPDEPIIPSEARRIVREELAALGGHLLTTYGQHDDDGNERAEAVPQLAALGGFLLEHYGDGTPAAE